MSIRPADMVTRGMAPMLGLVAALAIGAGMAGAAEASLAAVSLAVAAGVGFFSPPMLVFSVYYGLSQSMVSVHPAALPASLNHLLFFAFWGAVARQAAEHNLRLPRNAPLWATLALAVFLLASALTGYSAELGRQAAKAVVTLSAVSLGVAAMATSARRVRALFWAILIPTLLNGGVAAVEAVVNHGLLDASPHFFLGLFRINGISPNSIVFAHICMFALPMALFLMRHGTSPAERRWAAAAAAFLALLALRTLNRQSLLLLPILLVAAGLLFHGRMGRRLVMGAAAGAIVLGGVLFPVIMARIGTIGTIQDDPSFRIRRDNIINALRVARADPLLGAGLGSFPDAWWPVRSFTTYYNQYEEVSRKQEVDLNYIRLLAETGWMGLGANFLLYIFLIVHVMKQRRIARRAGNTLSAEDRSAWIDYTSVLLLLWILFLVSSAMQDTILYMRTWIMFGLSVACASFSRCALGQRKDVA